MSSENTSYVGFWTRFVANFVDGLVVSIVCTVIGLTLNSSDGADYPYLVFLVTAIYSVVMITQKGATLGKMACNIKVVGENGQKVDWGQAILREVIGKLISSAVLLLGYLWVAFDAKKQGWHDKIAKTYVVRA